MDMDDDDDPLINGNGNRGKDLNSSVKEKNDQKKVNGIKPDPDEPMKDGQRREESDSDKKNTDELNINNNNDNDQVSKVCP